MAVTAKRQPTTAAGWKRRALKAEKAIADSLVYDGAHWYARMNATLGAFSAAQQGTDAAKVSAFDAITANSRYVRQDNAIRKLLRAWAQSEASPVATCRAIYTELDCQPPLAKGPK